MPATTHADLPNQADDAADTLLAVRPAMRSLLIEDVCIRSNGDGRTVEAYCAAFNVRAEVNDEDGHYYEVNDPTSFNKTVKDNGTRFGVFYNHARTIWGTPDGALSVPIAVPVEAPLPDGHGVLTVSHYLDNPLADSILDGIKQRAIRGQSYTGRFMRSARTRATQRGELPQITRQEIAMKEYGPTVFPAFVEAHIVGTRSADLFMRDLLAMDADERAELFRQMQAVVSTTPVREPEAHPLVTANRAAGPADEPRQHSARQSDIAQRIRAGLTARSGK